MIYKLWIKFGLWMNYFDKKSVGDVHYYKNLLNVVIPHNKKIMKKYRKMK